MREVEWDAYGDFFVRGEPFVSQIDQRPENEVFLCELFVKRANSFLEFCAFNAQAEMADAHLEEFVVF